MKLGFQDYDIKLIILTSIALFSGIKADCPNGKEIVNFNIKIFHVAPRQLDASINALLDFPAIMNMIVYLDLALQTFAMSASRPDFPQHRFQRSPMLQSIDQIQGLDRVDIGLQIVFYL